MAGEKAVPTTLVISRHLVGLAIGAAVMDVVVLKELSLGLWAGSLFFYVAAAALVAGLAALFFTKSQAPHSARNFILTAWALVAFSMLGALMRPAVEGLDSSEPTQYSETSPPAIQQPSPPQMQPSAEVTSTAAAQRERWLARVRSLADQGAAGKIPVLDAYLSNSKPAEGAAWKAVDVVTLEAEQTWWADGAHTFIHLPLRAPVTIAAFEFNFAEHRCGAGPSSGRVVQLKTPFAANGSVIVAFPMGVKPGEACLAITRVWSRVSSTM